MQSKILDYTLEVIHKVYEEDGCKFSFSIYPEFYSEEDGLGVTGKKLVVAITPHGTFSFAIQLGKSGWKSGNTFYDNLIVMININAALITGHSVSQN